MYKYEEQKPKIFTSEGIAKLLEIRDKAREVLKISGVATIGSLMCTGDSWMNLACIEYLLETGQLLEVKYDAIATQFRIVKLP